MRVQRIIAEGDESCKAQRVETHLNLSDDAPRPRKSYYSHASTRCVRRRRE